MRYAAIGCAVALVLGVLVVGGSAVGAYNELVQLDQAVQAQWGQVQNVYQRRADLVPNLVETVKGAANFEKTTFTQVTEARAQVGQVTSQVAGTGTAPTSQQDLDKYQQAQAGLGNALSRLLVVVEKYPELKATQNFRDLQAQLEGTENRIAVERMRFNEAAQAFNTKRQSFPTVLIAGFFGSRFDVKPYFKAQEGAEYEPRVKF
jgi:LemA protein